MPSPTAQSAIWASTRRVRVALAQPSRGNAEAQAENKRPYRRPERLIDRPRAVGGNAKRDLLIGTPIRGAPRTLGHVRTSIKVLAGPGGVAHRPGHLLSGD